MKNRLILKPLKKGDIGNIMNWVNDPEIVKNFQNFKGFTRSEELKFIKKILKSKNDRVFSIFRRSDGKYIGQCAINQISPQNKLGRFGIFITKENWGNGFAEEAIGHLLHIAFSKLKLHKVWGVCWVTNKKAWHIYQKLGFKKEGILKDEYYWHGRYHDLIRMTVIKK
ncbi:MAG: GNAT family protein [bacterium]|nr:GNAT family protein [bacterium]